MQIGSQSFFHITPGNNNAEMVGQPGHAITDHECPPAGWAAGELVKEHFQISAVEMVHNFTLVHDDIMDNDEMRHGVPTVHKK